MEVQVVRRAEGWAVEELARRLAILRSVSVTLPRVVEVEKGASDQTGLKVWRVVLDGTYPGACGPAAPSAGTCVGREVLLLDTVTGQVVGSTLTIAAPSGIVPAPESTP